MHAQVTLRKAATMESQPAKRRRRQVRSDRDILVAPHVMDSAARATRWRLGDQRTGGGAHE